MFRKINTIRLRQRAAFRVTKGKNMKKLIIEARLNEWAGREENPNVPFTADEIARDTQACHAAGASVVHYHARTPEGGPDFTPENFAQSIRQIRRDSKILIHLTLGNNIDGEPPEKRMRHIEELCKDPSLKPDFATVEVGTLVADLYDAKKREYLTKDTVFINRTSAVEYYLKKMRALGVKPYLGSWSVGTTRQMVTFHDMGWLEEPVYMTYALTNAPIVTGHPANWHGLQAHFGFVPDDLKLEWTTSAVNGNLLAYAEQVIRLGGHISIGLGDYPYPELGQPTNSDLIAEVVRMAKAAGREVATAADAATMLLPPGLAPH